MRVVERPSPQALQYPDTRLYGEAPLVGHVGCGNVLKKTRIDLLGKTQRPRLRHWQCYYNTSLLMHEKRKRHMKDQLAQQRPQQDRGVKERMPKHDAKERRYHQVLFTRRDKRALYAPRRGCDGMAVRIFIATLVVPPKMNGGQDMSEFGYMPAPSGDCALS